MSSLVTIEWLFAALPLAVGLFLRKSWARHLLVVAGIGSMLVLYDRAPLHEVLPKIYGINSLKRDFATRYTLRTLMTAGHRFSARPMSGRQDFGLERRWI